ncbi:unnamed protein product [Cuscuta campestris]|uniref:Uncharacterized protein n=1 Tax=Cuscuta campestris TaxID=132261 RepID=A0A484NNH1_9ASTE|nr:unnamed protein product [Cuscuta campestris]
MTSPQPESSANSAITMEDLMHAIHNLSNELQATKAQVAALSTTDPHTAAGWRPPARTAGSGAAEPLPRMRVEAPRFNGEDPGGWVFRIQAYFDYFATPVHERVHLVAMLIDSPASDWFRYYQNNNCGVTWEAFLVAVRQRFDPAYYENYIGSLSKLCQTTTVLEYQSAFEALLNKVTGVPEPTLTAMYVAGLAQPVQGEVNLRQPRSLQEAFALARELSACHQTPPPNARRTWSVRPAGPAPTGATSTPGSGATSQAIGVKHSDNKPSSQLPIVRLSSAQKIERSKKGLCWYCDEKWVPGHHCKHRFLAFMGPDDDEEFSSTDLEDSTPDDSLIFGDVSSLHSLAELLKKDGFRWNSDADSSFARLKQGMVTAPVLRLPDFAETFYLETDASDVGIGAVLLQRGHPLAFFSKKLGPRRRSASTYHKELYAIVESVQKWRQYLLGREFVIRSDQRSLKDLLFQIIQTPEQQFYIRKLMGFCFRIEYKTGASNKVADALSRRGEDGEYAAMFTSYAQPLPQLLQDIKAENESLPDCKALCAAVLAGTGPAHISLLNGLLYYKHRLLLSPNSPLREKLLHEFHSTPIAGHQGVERTFKRLAAVFYWQGMRRDVKRFVAACVACQATKYSTQKPGGLLQPLPIPERVWDSASMDFITGLPPSRGFTVIMVVVDRLSKYAHFGLLPTGFDAPRVAQVFLEVVVKHHGFPGAIFSDRDSVFMSLFWRELMRLSGTSLKFSTAYHPQTDGQSEVINRGLEQYLHAFTHERPSRWATFIPWAELALNCSHHAGINMSPFQALYGRPPPPSLFPTLSLRARVPAVEELLQERAELLTDLKHHLERMQQRMRTSANQHRRDVQFNVGDLVLLKLQEYRQHSVAKPRSAKLARRYYGPFEVLERIGPVAYRLRLPDGCKIHDVFHVSLLRPFIKGSDSPPPPTLPSDFYKGKAVVIPISAGPSRTVLVDGQPREQWLIRWSEHDDADVTWEDAEAMQRHFPTLGLEDKAVPDPRRVDTALTEAMPLSDIDQNTVNFVPNFDKSQKEPSLPPARIPNLVLNNASGIEALTEAMPLSDIDQNEVNFVPNFDKSQKEPSLPPARIPNLVLNDASGIEVGKRTMEPDPDDWVIGAADERQENLEDPVIVSNPLGHSLSLKYIYPDCPLVVQGKSFPASLIELPHREFDVILGMDWLTANQAVVDYGAHTVRLKAEDGSDVLIRGELFPKAPQFISYMQARRLIHKKCEAFLCTVRDTQLEAPGREEIPTVCEFPDVFPDELPGLPPPREPTLLHEIETAQRSDDFCKQTCELASRGEKPDFSVREDGVLLYRDRVVVPAGEVCMVTNIPPHNLAEVVDAMSFYILNPEVTALTEAMPLSDIDQNAVNFFPNFDKSQKEPSLPPARISNLVLNDASGIEVCMATNTPPHNLGELVDAMSSYIHNQK